MENLFELTGVTHCYGRVCALRDVALTIAPGATGLIGQNGAGKSTLLQILLGLLRPTAGSVRVLGRPLRAAGLQLRGQVGFMPEREAFVPGLKGLEYVALAGELCGMPRRQALRRAHETLSYLGLEEARYRDLEQYSVGMRQRLKLAAALVHDPALLLLDEPTSGLDPDGRAAMLNVLRGLATRPGKSLLLSSHLLGDIERVCATAVILHAGRVLGTGCIADLRMVSAPSYRIRWDGAGEAFLANLRLRGANVQARPRADEARVLVPEGWSNREFFAAAREHQVLLTALEPEEENLEAVYHRLIGNPDVRTRNAGRGSAPPGHC
jgi:ABC-2 type transport system ATP-binding protein